MSLAVPTTYDSLIAVSLNALRVALPGVVSWARPRTQPLRQGGARTAYPAAYASARAGWRLVVAGAVAATGWQAPPIEAALLVELEIVGRGRRDIDRVVSAVLDALQAGGGLRDDCRVVELHATRRAPGRGEAPHVDVLLSLSDPRPVRILKELS